MRLPRALKRFSWTPLESFALRLAPLSLASRKKLPLLPRDGRSLSPPRGGLTCSEVRGEPLLLLCVVELLRGGGIAAATILSLLAAAAGRATAAGLDAGARDRVNAGMTNGEREGGRVLGGERGREGDGKASKEILGEIAKKWRLEREKASKKKETEESTKPKGKTTEI